jgi:hypothetical protein
MVALRHPHVLSFVAVCTRPPSLVSEYCSRGSLYDILREAKCLRMLQKELSWERRLKLVSEVASHRTLKSPIPSNVSNVTRSILPPC